MIITLILVVAYLISLVVAIPIVIGRGLSSGASSAVETFAMLWCLPAGCVIAIALYVTKKIKAMNAAPR